VSVAAGTPAAAGPPGDGVRVFVTVGTDHHRFDRLMGWVETFAAAHPEVSFLVQHGSSRPPRGVRAVPMLSRPDLQQALADADVVVVQGGPGSILESRSSGHKPVAVPRVASLDEVVDDHQVAFCRRLAAEGDLVLAETEDQFLDALTRAVVRPAELHVHDGGRPHVRQTADRLVALVEDLVRGGRVPPRGTSLTGGSTGTHAPGEANDR